MADVGQALLDANVVTQVQLDQNRRGSGDLISNLLKQGLLKDDEYVRAVTKAFGLQEVNFTSVKPDPQAVKAVPATTLRACQALPFRLEANKLHMAILDPGSEKHLARIKRAVPNLTLELYVVGPQALEKALTANLGVDRRAKSPLDLLPPMKELEAKLKNAVQEVQPEQAEDPNESLDKLEIKELDPPVLRIIKGLLIKALRMGASDLHVETMEHELRVRFRVDGCLKEVLRLPAEMKAAIASCLKIMSNMDIAERRIPQDGGIKFALGEGQCIDFRVSSLPNIYGEKMVLRVLGNSELRGSVDDLGFEGRALERVREAVANPYGMILVTGPTGSGKTTTLYTILNQLNDPDTNIVTAEDPVEYRLPGITQVNVRHASGLTFDAAMRSFLRQDPDTILVGEMRDYETAAIAVKAALTGHLVLSTLHTNDAPSTIVRLVDMGIEPYLVASAVKLVVAQRLVRKICDNCRVDVDLSALEKSDLPESTLASVEYLAKGTGCDVCNGIGYKGRQPVFEVLSVKSAEMKRAITEGGTEVQVAQIAKREGMMSLADSAIDMVNRGITSLEEAASIIMAE